MDIQQFLERLNAGETIKGDSDLLPFMHEMSQEALKLTAELNGSYYTPEEIQQLFSQLIGKEVSSSFSMFPPFSKDCGKNITVGENKREELSNRDAQKGTKRFLSEWNYLKSVRIL